MNDEKLMIGKQGVDPLTQGPHAPRELFSRFSKEASGFPLDAAIGASANLILNALRQEYKTHNKADEALTRLLEKMRQMLSEHYTSIGDRRSVFPFHQTISFPDVINMRKNRN